ncbi:MAG: DUF2202 domain-containing protein [Fusobacteriota bacterium]
MKKILSLAVISLLITGITFARGNNQRQDNTYLNSISSGEIYELSEEQKEDLIFLYQEEQMARDLYEYFADKYDARKFDNIANSEQQHMDAVRVLLEKYNLEVTDFDPGEYESEELNKLYADLKVKGDISYEEALEVGVKVEEVDIKDLENMLKIANPDSKIVFENLKRGSENHLSAFSGNRGNSRGNKDNRVSKTRRGTNNENNGSRQRRKARN